MTSMFFAILSVHIGAGLLCVGLGVVPLVTRKGGRLHRLSGRAYAIVMSVLLAAAWIMTAIHFSTYLLALSAMATLNLFSGLRVLGRKRPDIRPQDRAKPLDWVVAATIVVVSLATLYLVLTGKTGNTFAVSASLAGVGLVYGGYDLWRFSRPAAWPLSPNLWMYEHLVKMLGAYSAVVSAFSGNFMTFIPAPWSQLWPSMVFQLLAIAWIVKFMLQRRHTVRHAD